VLVEEHLHLFVGNVDAQLLVRVGRKIFETENVENSDRATFSAAKSSTSPVITDAKLPNNFPREIH